VTGGRSPSDASRDHYSYSHYANHDVAEGFDALRFSGPIGQYLSDTQENLVRDALGPLDGRHVLDVGTGTGRAAIALAAAGAHVVGIDASQEMLGVARRRAADRGVAVQFLPGDAHALEFGDGTFDASVSFRVLMHAPDWMRCVSELCRVTRWRVMVDFPALVSAAAVQSGARHLGKTLGLETEAYRVIAERRMAKAFSEHGFRIVSVHRQFVLPIALHKMTGSLNLTLAMERGMASLGLRRLFGSPVTMVAER
jgi:ubiquinone/menaquinone biosynthesis C-methylase UbiE